MARKPVKVKKEQRVPADIAAWREEEERREEEALTPPPLTDEQILRMVTPYKPPPGVVGKDGAAIKGAMAMDSVSEWGIPGAVRSSETLRQLAHEGIGFPGYPYLSAMMLRGEYQNIVGTLSREFFRKWGKFINKTNTADDPEDPKKDKIDKLHQAMDDYQVKTHLCRLYEQDLSFGAGRCVVVTKHDNEDGELAKELTLTPEKVGKGDLIRFQNVEPIWMTPDNYEATDPLAETFYIPESWWVLGKKINSSRIVQIMQRPMPDILKPAWNFGGLPLTLMAKPYVQNWLRTRQNVSDIINTMRVMVVTTNQVDQMGGTKTRAGSLGRRMRLFQSTMNNFGVLALNTAETFQNVTTPLTGLADLQNQSQEQICSITNIPIVKYTTNQPAGLGADSDGIIRLFYDTGESVRENVILPALKRMTDLIQLSVFGEIDDDLEWQWEPLYELTEMERMDLEVKKAQIRESDISTGQTTAEEGRKQIAGDENSIYAQSGVVLAGPAPGNPEDDYEGDVEGNSSLLSASAAKLPRISRDSDSSASASDSALAFDSFHEEDHPRDEKGKFSSAGSATENSKKFTPTQRQYLEWYSEQGFQEINSALRRGNAPKGMISALDGAMERSSLREDVKLYRIIEREHLKEMLGKDRVSLGDEFSDKGIASTGKDFYRGLGSGDVALVINAKKGQKGIDMQSISSNPQEREVLLPRGQKMKITRITAPSDKTLHKVLVHVDLHD